MRFDTVDKGEVNRAQFVAHYASGKVLNVAVALCHLEVPCKVITVVGGPARELVDRELSGLGISRHWVVSHSPTRTCVTLLEDATGDTTELVENGSELTSAELKEFASVFAHDAEHAEAVVLTGSLPQGAPSSIYAELIRPLRCPVVVDARGPELLAALPHRPWIVKPNREELAATLNTSLDSIDDLKTAMQRVVQLGAERVLVTHGPSSAWLLDGAQFYQIIPPKIESPINPIGSGDCLAAGIAARLVQDASPLDCVRFGIAAAAENVRHLLASRFDSKAVSELVSAVKVHAR
jgi:tagatose 6-phosphate kinase